jgi:hypothetical protein
MLMQLELDPPLLRSFAYEFNSGPLSSKTALLAPWKVGNCRRAIQYYMFTIYGVFLSAQECLYPDVFWVTGEFVVSVGEAVSFMKLKPGDLIFAQRNSVNQPRKGSPACAVPSFDGDVLKSLHTAIFTGILGSEIWHSSKVWKGSCYTSKSTFLRFYQPIAVKRILDKRLVDVQSDNG